MQKHLLHVVAVSLLLLAACAPVTKAPPAPAAGLPPAAAAADPPWQLEWARGAVFYEVFVRSFADSDGDGIGDLRGLAAKLDYLNDGRPGQGSDLEVDGLWLMPVFASPSYHGYDVTDYRQVNPDYGSEADLRRLCEEAHRRGLKVIVDLMINHTSDRHPWFLDSRGGPSSPKRDWYIWRADDPGWTQPWGGQNRTWHPYRGEYYYGLFWSGMPDLNFRNPEVRREVEQIAEFWLARGVDGFRLDAARHIVEAGPGQGQAGSAETHAYWREFSRFVRRTNPRALLVGEVWSDPATVAEYFGSTDTLPGGDELPMNFDFDLAGAIVEAAKGGTAEPVRGSLERVAAVYPPGVLDAPFLTNHDMVRVATQLANDAARLRSAAAVLLTVPGTPFVYYGEEVGMQNGPERRDEDKRMPMAWDGSPTGGFTSGVPWHPLAPGHAEANVAAHAGPESLLARYRALIRARHGSAALRAGSLALLDAPAGVLAFVREAGSERVLVAHNLGSAAVEFATGDVTGTAAEALFADSGAAISRAGAAWRATLPPGASAAWLLR
ncbi:MAG: DUF3459 domain-containing protein [Acidobacteria bacterium]|nr:DUF3459 domain-containing protein [Acidobacteriota bacterium]